MFKKAVVMLIIAAAAAIFSGCQICSTKCEPKKDVYVDLLCELIKTRPESSNIPAVNKAQKIMMEFLKERGIHCTMERDGERDVLFAATHPGKVMDYILCVHLDVVPAADAKQYEPYIEGDRIYGRGTKDCLGSAIAAAKILCTLPAGKKVGCIFTSDEEIGGPTTAFMVKQGYTATKAGYVIDGGNGVFYAHKGILYMKVTAYGKGGHSSRPWGLDNPVSKLVKGLNNVITKWDNPANGNDWRASLAVTILNAGSVGNRIPDTAEAIINVRFVKPEERAQICDFVRKHSGLEVVELRYSDPFATDPESEITKKTVAAYNRAFGRNVKPSRMNGATDARHLCKMPCPVLITGVEGSNSHGLNEFLVLSSIDKMVSMMHELL